MKSWTIMTKNSIAALACLLAFATLQIALAQVVERPRPAGWENLVPGGRFMVTGGEGERP